MSRVLITTVPFGDKDRSPIDKLENAGIDYVINPIGRKLTEQELAEMIGDFDVLIAGTECISNAVFQRAKKLKFISRVGIGLDSVDLIAAQERGIKVSYTPDAPAPAVAELTIGFIFALLRSTHVANLQMHQGKWTRHFGRRISDVTIGIIGTGRIGGNVLRFLAGFPGVKVLVHDINPNLNLPNLEMFEKVSLDEIYLKADVISLHIPLNSNNKNMIMLEQLLSMKSDALLINTSRGGIINEMDLITALNSGHLGGVAIDVFETEPYIGELSAIERCLLTSHMGSMSFDCRARMEIEATEEAIRFLNGGSLQSLVPIEEYEIQKLRNLM
jgi:D-3-phosphoglycerate dehydrogenase